MISKLASSKYVGSRSGSWVKTECIKRQEFVIVGWTPSDKSRTFRSFILGLHDQGHLRYAGKVGTGFGTDELFRLMELMRPFEIEGRTLEAPRVELRGAHWIVPKLVAEIAYTEMTNEGTLRHPSYLGLRADKKPDAVVLETEAPAAMVGAPGSGVKISNRERVIYPESAITKGELADYYEAVAPIICPGSDRDRSVWCDARRAGPGNASSRNMMRGASGMPSGMSASRRRTAMRSPISISTQPA